MRTARLGRTCREILGLNDQVIDFAVTANRPDARAPSGSRRGRLRACLGKKLHLPEPSYQAKGRDIRSHISVSVEDQDLCPRYYGRVVKNVRIAGPPPG